MACVAVARPLEMQLDRQRSLLTCMPVMRAGCSDPSMAALGRLNVRRAAKASVQRRRTIIARSVVGQLVDGIARVALNWRFVVALVSMILLAVARQRGKLRLGSTAENALLQARRRWGLGLVRFVVKIVVKIELMAAKDPAEAVSFAVAALEAARSGVSDFTGKENYQFGDITKAAVAKFTGKSEYELGDITKSAVKKFTGKEQYQFGDITKTAASKITGKEEYQFGDITRSVVGKFFPPGQESPTKDTDASGISNSAVGAVRPRRARRRSILVRGASSLARQQTKGTGMV